MAQEKGKPETAASQVPTPPTPAADQHQAQIAGRNRAQVTANEIVARNQQTDPPVQE